MVFRPVPPLEVGRVPDTPVVRETLVIVLFAPEIVLLLRVATIVLVTRVSEVVVDAGNKKVWLFEPPLKFR